MIRELPDHWRSQIDLEVFAHCNGLSQASADSNLLPWAGPDVYTGELEGPEDGPGTLEENLREDYDLHGGDLTHEECERLGVLLRDLLVLEPDKRRSAKEIVEHPWLHGSLLQPGGVDHCSVG